VWRHKIEYFLFRVFLALFRRSPAFLLSGWRHLVLFFFRCDPLRSRIVAANLQIAFPDWTPAARAELIRRFRRHFAAVVVEIGRCFARRDRGHVLAHGEVRGLEHIRQALAAGRGAILFSAHFGNWEWIPLLLSEKLEQPLHSIARPMNNPLVEERVLALRRWAGSEIMYRQGALKWMLKHLQAGRLIFSLIDQNTVPREGVFVDFFGRPACTSSATAQLHLKKGVPLVPLFLHYEGDRFVLEVQEQIHFTGSGDYARDVTVLTQRLTAVIEAAVRRHPEQWFWFHHRWKNQPQGECHANEQPR